MAIRNKRQLGDEGIERTRELETLKGQRDRVKVQETNLVSDIAEMERKLYEQDNFFKRQSEGVQGMDPKVMDATLKTIHLKEMEFAAQQASKVNQIK